MVAWTTEYYGLAVESMRRAGRRIDDEILAHISPAHSENINFFGAIEVDIEGELAQLGPTGCRPLRVLPQRLCESRQPLLQVAVEGLPVRADGSSGRGELAMGAPLPVRG